LRRLDVQSNRLLRVEGLATQNETLEELYLADNAIPSEGCTSTDDHPGSLDLALPNLSVLDLSNNKIKLTQPFAHLTSLDELWLSGNAIENFETDVAPLAALGESLDTVYLEYNPIQSNDPLYRKKLAELIPSLSQIDANMVGATAAAAARGMPTVGGAAARPPAQQQQQQQQATVTAGAVGGVGIVSSSPPVMETEEEKIRRLQEAVIERAKAEAKQKKKQEAASSSSG